MLTMCCLVNDAESHSDGESQFATSYCEGEGAHQISGVSDVA